MVKLLSLPRVSISKKARDTKDSQKERPLQLLLLRRGSPIRPIRPGALGGTWWQIGAVFFFLNDLDFLVH